MNNKVNEIIAKSRRDKILFYQLIKFKRKQNNSIFY